VIAEKPPPGHHPATPRFLLSLLATAFYLSIPSLISQAYNSILSSVGPLTCIQYLNFALGQKISDPAPDEPESVIGLENLARPSENNHPDISVQTTKGEESDLDELIAHEGADMSSNASSKESHCKKYFYYGSISTRIGEAVACWLARWAPDILEWEESQCQQASSSTCASSSRSRSQTLPSDFASAQGRDMSFTTPAPRVFRRGGLSAEWVNALVSCDTLFVKGEWHRYNFAKRIVEMRRKSGLESHEEEQWLKMFSEGIYYANMSNDDLIVISQDNSSITEQPFVPLRILQAALWDQGSLRYHIVAARPGTSPPSTPPPKDKDLGIMKTTATILSEVSAVPSREGVSDTVYYPVPPDSSSRYGDIGKVEEGSAEQGNESQASNSTRKPATIENFFGIKIERRAATSCISFDATGKERWSSYPPFRFSIEFWDAERLKEKSRLYSQTIWYAGNLFNVYVQIVRKKGVQLGVYLHRQSSVDPIPPVSSPASTALSLSRSDTWGPLNSHGTQSTSLSSSPPSTFHYSPSIHPPSRSTTPNTIHGSSTVRGSLPSLALTSIPAATPAHPLSQPYRDPRPAVCAYFSINVASAYGTSLTKFTSAPDSFAVSQSWGWKSSSSRTEEYLAGLDDKSEGQRNELGNPQIASLRATIVIGVV
jgi:hypothetical protein